MGLFRVLKHLVKRGKGLTPKGALFGSGQRQMRAHTKKNRTHIKQFGPFKHMLAKRRKK